MRMGLLLMALVVALAAIGVASALWSKTLTVDGSVSTGTVDMTLVYGGSYENETYVENNLKDVASCTAGWVGDNSDELVVRVENGYPSFECWAEFEIMNTGTIPIHIYQPDLTINAGPDELTVELLDAPYTLPDNVVVDACYADDTQLHAGDVAYCAMYIHVEQGAMQDHTYTFTGTIEGRQYNEPRP